MRTIWLISIFLLFAVSAQASNLSTLEDLRAAFAIQLNNATVADSEATEFINIGMDQVATDLLCVEKLDTIVTSDGSSTYSLNTDAKVNGVKHIELKSKGVRYGLDQVPYDQIGRTGAKEGCPKTFYQFGQYITVSPEPTASCSLVVLYAAKPGYISQAADSTLIPEVGLRQIGLLYSTYLYYMATRQYTAATTALTSYQAAIALKRELLKSTTTVVK